MWFWICIYFSSWDKKYTKFISEQFITKYNQKLISQCIHLNKTSTPIILFFKCHDVANNSNAVQNKNLYNLKNNEIIHSHKN